MSLTNSQYEQVMRNYNRLQLTHQHETTARRLELYKAIPSLKAIDDEIVTIGSSFAIQKINGNLPANANLQDEIKKLTDQKTALLKSHGYRMDYLDVDYNCSDCKDTGYIDGHKCHCFKQAEIDLVYEQSHLKGSVNSAHFSNFRLDYYRKELVDKGTGRNAYDLAAYALETSQAFVANFDKGFHENLLFYGPVGVGKTFLTNCISNELIKKNYSVIYFTAFSLFEIFQKKVFEHDSKAKEEFKNVYDCDLLIIDDLGTEVINAFTSSQLFNCINERLLRHKSTIISSNLLLSQIEEKYSERTSSRITGNYSLVKLNGDDIRILKSM